MKNHTPLAIIVLLLALSAMTMDITSGATPASPSAAVAEEASGKSARIVRIHGVPTMEADGAPLLLVGAQCDIWRSTRQDEMTVAFFDAYRAMHATTVSVGIPWSKTETAKDCYDFRFLDWFIGQAQKRCLKLVINLFNSNVCGKVQEGAGTSATPVYAPPYILDAPDDFQRMILPGPWKYDLGGPPLCPNDPRTLERERQLCSKVAEHLKLTDVRRTVIMVQIDNEFYYQLWAGARPENEKEIRCYCRLFVREGMNSRFVGTNRFSTILGDIGIEVGDSDAGIIARIAPTEVVLAIPNGRVVVETLRPLQAAEGRFDGDHWIPERECAVRTENKAAVFDLREPKVILLKC